MRLAALEYSQLCLDSIQWLLRFGAKVRKSILFHSLRTRLRYSCLCRMPAGFYVPLRDRMNTFAHRRHITEQ